VCRIFKMSWRNGGRKAIRAKDVQCKNEGTMYIRCTRTATTTVFTSSINTTLLQQSRSPSCGIPLECIIKAKNMFCH
jgi:hypothetical protein